MILGMAASPDVRHGHQSTAAIGVAIPHQAADIPIPAHIANNPPATRAAMHRPGAGDAE
jgi:hypothetical protein